MLLSNLIGPNKGIVLQGPDLDISDVSADSRLVRPGSLFVAVPGTKEDGARFIDSALAAGAKAILMGKGAPAPALPEGIALLRATDVREALSYVASRLMPDQSDTIVAVTGTSGKTSTVQFTRGLWESLGYKAASLGTLGLIAPDEKRYGSLTTPDPVILHDILNGVARRGVTHLALEASSHGIELHRLDNVRLKAAAFTNLSRDHLDYHKTMEAYFAAKLRLFTDLLPEGSGVVLNADAPEYAALYKVCKACGHNILPFGRQGRTIKLKKLYLDPKGQRLLLEVMGKDYDVLLPLMGAFQAWNAMAALGLVLATGGDQDKAVAAIEKLEGVPGRMQFVGFSASGGAVFVDYAHKPAALENVLASLRPHIVEGARLHVVFGCGGDRDKGKRPLMGGIAQKMADNVIVTDDNPRSENPVSIRAEILQGCTAGGALTEIGDRAKAIAAGIAALKQNDILVIAGKGHENGQIVGDQVLPFNDVEVAGLMLQREIG